ncbi:hypothetical protein DVS77_31530 [Mycolicibacterium moriokaense]|nr:hypothetical protein DVS77_31530 [Mycolicibacterium moriokaense]
MSIAREVDALQQLITDLRRCMTSLVAAYGADCLAVRRVVNDAESILNGFRRLEIDIEELEVAGALIQAQASRQMIQIPDTQYDHDFWRGVDHEGIGGRARPA